MSDRLFNFIFVYLYLMNLLFFSNGFLHEIPFNKRRGKIVGGEIINIQEAPFNVALEYLTRQICGGAILTRRWVVTAAHCFGKGVFLKSQAVVRAGSGLRLTGGTEHEVKDILKHPEFIPGVNDCDAALLRVHPYFKYSSSVTPISLPSVFRKPREGDLVQVFGFGYTMESGNPSRHLRTVYLPVYNHHECVSIYKNTLNVTYQMICAGYKNGGRDACVLDSGGPLVWKGSLHGVISWGYGCAREMHPGVFTDLTTPLMKVWILQNIK